MCGEHPLFFRSASPYTGSSPHVRGARRLIPAKCSTQGIIPACAGSTADWDDPLKLIGDHPRMCGEHDLMVINSLEELGSSPHVRGALLKYLGSHA